MIEDKLTAEQRVRLESVAQANQLAGPRGFTHGVDDLLAIAARIEGWIREGKDGGMRWGG